MKNNNNEKMIVRNTVSENLPAWQTRKPNLQSRVLERDMLAVSRFVNMKRKAIVFDAAAIAAIFFPFIFRVYCDSDHFSNERRACHSLCRTTAADICSCDLDTFLMLFASPFSRSLQLLFSLFSRS